jgi:hypothetical protein
MPLDVSLMGKHPSHNYYPTLTTLVDPFGNHAYHLQHL